MSFNCDFVVPSERERERERGWSGTVLGDGQRRVEYGTRLCGTRRLRDGTTHAVPCHWLLATRNNTTRNCGAQRMQVLVAITTRAPKLKEFSELRRCVQVEVAVPNGHYGLFGRKATLSPELKDLQAGQGHSHLFYE